jgi:hypothetical protein
MKKYCFLFIVLCINYSFAQFEAIDKFMDAMPSNLETATVPIANYISSNFKTEDEKARAAFYWTASTISYDVENMLNQPPNQSPEDRVNRTLKSKKGVCMHYAQLFYDIMNKLNIETVLIDGYTKDNDGKISVLSHVWCASKINSNWYLFDVTWGSGFVNNSKFTRKINNRYYKVEPKSLIDRHMPFDYLWQFSNNPITNQEFYDAKLEATNKTLNFDYLKEIELYKNLSELDKSIQRANRIQKNGLKNKLITERYEFEKQKISSYNQKNDFSRLAEINADYNESMQFFVDFLNYKNRKFLPSVADDELKSKIQIPLDKLSQCINDINELKDIKRENLAPVTNLKRLLMSSKINMESNLKFVEEFISKDVSERAKMIMTTKTIRK